jgi:hypothetical protein
MIARERAGGDGGVFLPYGFGEMIHGGASYSLRRMYSRYIYSSSRI